MSSNEDGDEQNLCDDSSECSDEDNSAARHFVLDDLEIDDHVLVGFEGNRCVQYFVGRVQEIDGNSLTSMFMRKQHLGNLAAWSFTFQMRMMFVDTRLKMWCLSYQFLWVEQPGGHPSTIISTVELCPSIMYNSQNCGYLYVTTCPCKCANLPGVGQVVTFYLRWLFSTISQRQLITCTELIVHWKVRISMYCLVH